MHTKKFTKSTSIIIRTTELQKNLIKQKAKLAGMNLSEYILKLSENATIVSLIEGQRLIKDVHKLYNELDKINNPPITANIKNTISKNIINLTQHIKSTSKGDN